MKNILLILIILFTSLVLMNCGIKEPLYFPTEKKLE